MLNSTRTAITRTPSIEQDWTLDPTGNWSGFVTKASGSTTLNQSRTANSVNEITNITESTGPTWVVPAYDPAGNTTTMPQVTDPTQSFTATYDAWNRMTSISNSAGLVAQYQYDGRNFRIVKQVFGTGAETRHFYFTSGWQDIEGRVGTATTMDKQYVWGVRHIDELVCRDDATPSRLYATQDAIFNLTAITGTVGAVTERYVYEPYGVWVLNSAAWVPITGSGFSWRIGPQGLGIDVETLELINRERYRLILIFNFATRDLKQYIDGGNHYNLLANNPAARLDPYGTTCSVAVRCGPVL